MPDERAAPAHAALGIALPDELSAWLWEQKSGVPAGLLVLVSLLLRKSGEDRYWPKYGVSLFSTPPILQRKIATLMKVTVATVHVHMCALEDVGLLRVERRRSGFIFALGDALTNIPHTGPPGPDAAKPPMPGAVSPLRSTSDVDQREALHIKTSHNQPEPILVQPGQSHCSTKPE